MRTRIERGTRRHTCPRCGQRLRVPAGWTLAAAIRKHYWAKHPDVMQTIGKGVGR